MPLYKWSRTSNTNASADSTINYSEGQAPSSLNDSARAAMAAIAMYRDDVAGAIVTAGTSTAYTVSSFSVFDTLADMNGMEVWFTPHTTNGATVTLNVDSLGAKPLRSAPNTELLAGVLVQGTPYGATYNNSDGAWYLKGFYGASPYLIPLGGMVDYIGTSAPTSQFVLPYGQAISRTTYASLFALVGTTFGTGDGSTTFNVPDLRGRLIAGVDNMGGTGAGRIRSDHASGVSGTTLGATGGADQYALVTANLPAYTPSGAISITFTAPVGPVQTGTGGTVNIGGSGSGGSVVEGGGLATATFAGAAQGGTSAPFANLPPLMMLNKILRII